jgi:hypothetical protein
VTLNERQFDNLTSKYRGMRVVKILVYFSVLVWSGDLKVKRFQVDSLHFQNIF